MQRKRRLTGCCSRPQRILLIIIAFSVLCVIVHIELLATRDQEPNPVESVAPTSISSAVDGHISVILISRSERLPWATLDRFAAAAAQVNQRGHRNVAADAVQKIEVIIVYTNLLEQQEISRVKLNSSLAAFTKLVHGMRERKGSGAFPSYTELCQKGYLAIDPQASHVLFLNDAHVPSSQYFLGEMYRPFTQYARLGAVQATVLTPACSHSADATSVDYARGGMIVVDRGFEVMLGMVHEVITPLVKRRLSGYPAQYRGFNETEPVTMGSSYALMVDRVVYQDHSGLIQSSPSKLQLFGHIFSGHADLTFGFPRRMMHLSPQREGSLSRSGSGPGAAQTNSINATAVASPTNWTVFGDIVSHDDRGSQRSMQAARFLHSQYADEESGWDFSLRLHDSNWTLLASKATVVLETELIAEPVQSFLLAHEVGLLNPSYIPTGDFAVRWTEKLHGLHGSARPGSLSPPLRIVWYYICCRCCGFLSEILRYVLPLHQRHQVLLLSNHPFEKHSCFCSGAPYSDRDLWWRSQITLRQYAFQALRRDEKIIWISHTPPMLYPDLWMQHRGLGSVQRAPDYFVGRSMYEFTRISRGWMKHYTMADEIWVPSTFVETIFRDFGVPAAKLLVIPESIDTDFYDPQIVSPIDLPLQGTYAKWRHYCNKELPTSATPYRFFSNFKWEPRKGWDVLFEAYNRAFSNLNNSQQPVSLYVLTVLFGDSYATADMGNVSEVRRRLLHAMRQQFDEVKELSDLPHFCLITEELAEEEVVALYRSVDAFVLPTRGEGWGLPAMQAMSMGLPTISTGWGGSLEFMAPNASFHIRLDGLDEVPVNSVYGWQPGKKWAVPSVLHTQQLMQLVYTEQAYGRSVGARARRHIENHFSGEVVANIVDERLKRIREILLVRPERNDSRRIFWEQEYGKSGAESYRNLLPVPHMKKAKDGLFVLVQLVPVIAPILALGSLCCVVTFATVAGKAGQREGSKVRKPHPSDAPLCARHALRFTVLCGFALASVLVLLPFFSLLLVFQ